MKINNNVKTNDDRISFCKDSLGEISYPDLLEIQLKSFRDFFAIDSCNSKNTEQGLSKVFKENFPIDDPGGNYILHFVDYTVGSPRHTPIECVRNSTTYSVPIRVKFRLVQTHDDAKSYDNIEQEVFLGSIPYMTPSGSFIINGIERVIVSLIHKSVGVFFSQTPSTSEIPIYSARVIPFQGAWIEFSVSANGVIYAYIDRKKKICLATLLRAIGYSTDKDILDIFNLAIEVEASKDALNQHVGSRLIARIVNIWRDDIVDESTGEITYEEKSEVILERGTIINEQSIEIILKSGVKSICIARDENDLLNYNIIYNTLDKDTTNSSLEAAHKIYKKLRGSDAVDDQVAKDTVNNLFFSTSRYDLGEIGRYKINKKLNLDIPADVMVLTKEDIIQIINHLIYLVNTKSPTDDVDHLTNRRIRTVGEQLYIQFNLGLARLARVIRDRMNVRDSEDFKIVDLINTKPFANVVNAIFSNSSPLSQFMDQVNPLSEITHKRRVSSIGPGGLAKDTRVGFEARDVHYTYAGRLCAIETPEGPNIGLISHLALCSHLNSKGFLETPYRKVENGKVDTSGNLIYLSVEEEDLCNIAESTTKLDVEGKIVEQKVKVRYRGDLLLIEPEQVHYMEVASNQIVSLSTSLVPFLEHNDASRALMGANMQRQAIPLLKPQAPIVGTGMEKHVVTGFNGVIFAEGSGVIKYADASKIVVQYERSEEEQLVSFGDDTVTYDLIKFYGTNQKTCVNYSPVVKQGDYIKEGQFLTEGYSTQGGELALGCNLKVAYLSWRGYTYEDAIVLSERLVKDDVLTSLHIEEYTLDIRETKLGAEEFTSEIPNISEDAIKNLDVNGIVRVGAVVHENDILIGKLTPKGESDPTPEEKLLKAIFGNKAGEVKDVSLRLPASVSGVVIDTKLLSRSVISSTDLDKASKMAKLKKEKELLKKSHSHKLKKLKSQLLDKLTKLLTGETSLGVCHKFGDILIAKGIVFTAINIEKNLFPEKNIYRDETSYNVPEEADLISDLIVGDWVKNPDKNNAIAQILKNYLVARNNLIRDYNRDKYSLEVGDELPFGVLKRAKVYVAQKRKIKVGDKMAGRHGNKGIVAKIAREEDMPFLADGTRVDIVLSPLGIPSRMNLGQLFEAALGWAGMELNKKYATPVFSGATEAEVNNELKAATIPMFGKVDLYDGLTGKKFDQKVTVGVAYMLKLNHMVDDKMHARSTSDYSLITCQPLKGKALEGGQRFGEMEVWALEAYAAAYTLREMLTIKSDDIVGRTKAYEAIVHGKNIAEPGLPESFKVLLHYLRGLNLDIDTY